MRGVRSSEARRLMGGGVCVDLCCKTDLGPIHAALRRSRTSRLLQAGSVPQARGAGPSSTWARPTPTLSNPSAASSWAFEFNITHFPHEKEHVQASARGSWEFQLNSVLVSVKCTECDLTLYPLSDGLHTRRYLKDHQRVLVTVWRVSAFEGSPAHVCSLIAGRTGADLG